MKDLIDPDGDNARFIVEKLHVNWGRASASQATHILTDAGGVGANVPKVVDSAV